MKYLLTSSGISNPSIENALVELLGKPISEATAVVVPTGMHPFPGGGEHGYRFLIGQSPGRMLDLGWKSISLLELSALPSIKREYWVDAVKAADALLIWGGHAPYLCYWMRESGLADLLPTLRDDMVYVGTSASSMMAGPDFGELDYELDPPLYSLEPLGLVNFSFAPHLDHPMFPGNTLAELEKWAAPIPAPAYALDDQSAITVVDGEIEVVSEGHWHLFEPVS
jgi:dipeptidase E